MNTMTRARRRTAASATASEGRPLIVWDFVLTTIIILIGIPLVIVGGVVALMLPMASAGCGGDITCEDTQFMVGWVVALAAPLLFIASAMIAIVRIVRRKVSFWFALLGLLLTAAVWFGGVLLVVGAVPGATV